MNIDPKIWGSRYWFVLHTITFTYPQYPNDTCKRKYYDLIQNLPLFLPHEEISKEFSYLLNLYPVKPYLDSKSAFVRWMHFIHNQINKKIGKEEFSYNEFINKMNKVFQPPIEKPKTVYSMQNLYAIIFILIMCGLITLELRKKYV